LWIKDAANATFAQSDIFHLNILQQLMVQHRWLATLLLTLGLVIELGSLLLCFRKTRWIAATLLIIMHISIDLMMSIHFTYFFTLLLITCYPWAPFLDYILQRNKR